MGNKTNLKAFVPAINSLDLSKLDKPECGPKEIKEVIKDLYQIVNKTTLAFNMLNAGGEGDANYSTNEEVATNNYFLNELGTPLQIYRKVLPLNWNIPTSPEISVLHGLDTTTDTFRLLNMYGTVRSKTAVDLIGTYHSIPQNNYPIVPLSIWHLLDSTRYYGYIQDLSIPWTSADNSYIILEYTK